MNPRPHPDPDVHLSPNSMIRGDPPVQDQPGKERKVGRSVKFARSAVPPGLNAVIMTTVERAPYTSGNTGAEMQMQLSCQIVPSTRHLLQGRSCTFQQDHAKQSVVAELAFLQSSPFISLIHLVDSEANN